MTERERILRSLSPSEREHWRYLFGEVAPVVLDDPEHRDARPEWYSRPTIKPWAVADLIQKKKATRKVARRRTMAA